MERKKWGGPGYAGPVWSPAGIKWSDFRLEEIELWDHINGIKISDGGFGFPGSNNGIYLNETYVDVPAEEYIETITFDSITGEVNIFFNVYRVNAASQYTFLLCLYLEIKNSDTGDRAYEGILPLNLSGGGQSPQSTGFTFNSKEEHPELEGYFYVAPTKILEHFLGAGYAPIKEGEYFQSWWKDYVVEPFETDPAEAQFVIVGWERENGKLNRLITYPPFKFADFTIDVEPFVSFGGIGSSGTFDYTPKNQAELFSPTKVNIVDAGGNLPANIGFEDFNIYTYYKMLKINAETTQKERKWYCGGIINKGYCGGELVFDRGVTQQRMHGIAVVESLTGGWSATNPIEIGLFNIDETDYTIEIV